jgi:trk system potassium uptake protein
MKIIIVGAGEVGYHIAEKLSGEDQDVIVIDKDPEKTRRIAESLDAQALLGSGTSPEMLKTSGIKNAEMLVAATDSDEVNLISCLLAKNLNPYIVKIARVRNREYLDEKNLFSQDLLGIDRIINPESVMVESIRNLMMVPGASDVVDFEDGRVKLVGIMIKADSPFAGRKLLSFQELEGSLLVGAIVREQRVLIPHGEDTIRPNDLVYLVVKSDEMPYGLGFFEVEPKEGRRVIIVGAGETGSALASALEHEKMSVKIIEKDAQKCAALAEKLDKAIVIHGDGTDKDLLQEENVNGVDFMVAITNDEENNILISLLAKAMGAKKTITRINKLSYISLVSPLASTQW